MAKFIETDKDKAFARLWLEAWNWPDAWSRKAIDADKSPYPGFSEWLNATGSRQVSLELLERVLVRFREADGDIGRYGPKLFLIKQAYEQAAQRPGTSRAEAQRHGPPCEACDGTGLVLIPYRRDKGQNGRTRILVGFEPAERVHTTVWPCLCDRGRKMRATQGRNAGWADMDEATLRRGFEARIRPVDVAWFETECRRLAGFDVDDQAARTEQDPEFQRRIEELIEKHAPENLEDGHGR